MDSFELNKLIGAFLAVVFVVMSVSIASDSIFAAHAPEKPGYIIEAAEPAAGGDAPAEAGPSIPELMQTADAAAGEQAFRRCAACHTAEEGGANKVGPNLWGVVNRPIASHEGFNYSAAMREFSQGGSVVWDWEHLSGFTQAPRAYISGTAMAFAGIKNPQEEANLLVYLRTLSNDPAPLPEVAAAPAEGDEAAPAEGEAPADGAAPAEDAAPADGAAPAEGTAPAEDAAPAEEPAAPAQDAAPAEQPAAPTAPAQPDATDDGSSAAPETDAGTGPGSETPGQEATPPPPANQ
ncbi:cytochrome c family protein [Mesorhizobium sp. CAU 1732]|uniref:c-type cytochrome n=1 Tax=Mesorhizobium sp. CAU 1732 TaxID=3140358 RepID=UPI00325FE310